ncbi:MAG: hypothetical protein AB7F53_08490 [Nitrososphaeraceae archaeon]
MLYLNNLYLELPSSGVQSALPFVIELVSYSHGTIRSLHVENICIPFKVTLSAREYTEPV